MRGRGKTKHGRLAGPGKLGQAGQLGVLGQLGGEGLGQAGQGRVQVRRLRRRHVPRVPVVRGGGGRRGSRAQTWR